MGRLEGARVLGLFFFLERMLVFSCDFENLPTISWMEEGESVEYLVDLKFSGCFLPGGIL